MINQIKKVTNDFPRQYWVLFWGTLFNSVGNYLVLPFLTIFLSQKLKVSLTSVAILLSVRSIATLLSSFLIGPLTDSYGRKKIMVLSLATTCVSYILLAFGNSYLFFGLVMSLSGLSFPLYRIGADAMLTDIIPENKRIDAFSLMRMITNAGISIGPMIGGFLALSSYFSTFIIAAVFLGIYSIFIEKTIIETLPKFNKSESTAENKTNPFVIFGDRSFLLFCLITTLTHIATIMMFLLLPVYAKEQYGMPESRFGFIMASNAIMIVLFQYSVTHITRKYNPLIIMGFGALLYAFGLGSVSLGSDFSHFLISMIILTLGELILAPTAMTYAANLAPTNLRGLYMSIFHLTLGIALGLGPIFGGILNDYIYPKAIWYGGAILSMTSSLGYFIFALYKMRK